VGRGVRRSFGPRGPEVSGLGVWVGVRGGFPELGFLSVLGEGI
jgi:hypothetical protein